MPIHINPEQRGLWFDLLSGDLTPGEFRVQEHQGQWVLHVTVEYEVADPDEPDDPTYVGFDIGESKLLVGCACRDDGAPNQPMLVDGNEAKRLRKTQHTTRKRLQSRDADWRDEWRDTYFGNALTDIVEKASRRAVEYACQFSAPVIVLEDLSYIRNSMDYGTRINRRLHAWVFAHLRGRIEDKAADAGVLVVSVNAAYTSQTCHACGHIGYRKRQGTFRCTNSECWVSKYQADINGAANIAARADPWGESLPWKPAGDDSPRDGSTLDSATTPIRDRGRPDASGAGKNGSDDNASASTPRFGGAGSSQTTLDAWCRNLFGHTTTSRDGGNRRPDCH
jgi:IS605 OrfB family transposase